MKTLLLSTILFFTINLNAQDVNIPDANFKSYLVGNTAINTNSDTEIQVSEANAFTGVIDVYDSGISDLTGIEAFTILSELNCGSNFLTSLDVSNNTSLVNLDCRINNLTSLGLSVNTSLTELICYGNTLTLLGVTNNTALTYLECHNNPLTSLDISNNNDLTDLYCGSNNLTLLNVSNCINLINLNCYNNALTSLDVSNNVALINLECGSNLLECLNVKNGNNTNFPVNNSWSGLQAQNNPNLTCIEVDDVNYSTTNWVNIDSQTSFSTDCGNDCTACTPTSSSITAEELDSYTAPSGAVYTTGGVYNDTILNTAGCDSIITIDLSLNFTGIGELNTAPKQLIKIVDLLGRETPFKPNTALIYIYDDGTVERKVVLK